MTIDEQIALEREMIELDAQIHGEVDPMMAARIASLEELKRIREVQMPDEPEITRADDFLPTTYVVRRTDYDTLRDLLKRESAKRKACAALEQDEVGAPCGYLRDMTERAEAAESKLAAIEKMGREPSEGMSQAGYMVDSTVAGTG
jgi:hypothetical protein